MAHVNGQKTNHRLWSQIHSIEGETASMATDGDHTDRSNLVNSFMNRGQTGPVMTSTPYGKCGFLLQWLSSNGYAGNGYNQGYPAYQGNGYNQSYTPYQGNGYNNPTGLWARETGSKFSQAAVYCKICCIDNSNCA